MVLSFLTLGYGHSQLQKIYEAVSPMCEVDRKKRLRHFDAG
jgi:hypothetical protein